MRIKFLIEVSLQKISLLFFLFPLSASGIPSSLNEGIPKKITLAANVYCPYNCQPGAEDPGIMVEVAQKAFGVQNLNYIELPWEKALQEALDEHIDGVIGTTPNTMPNFIHTKTIAKSVMCFYVRKENPWHYKDHPFIRERKLGTISSYSYSDFMDLYINHQKENLTTEPSSKQVLLYLLKMLNMKRIDKIIDDEAVLNNLLSHNPDLATNIKQAGCVLDPTAIYGLSIGFPKKSKIQSTQYVSLLNETIDKMIQNGEMDKLLKKYNLKK